MHNLIAPGNSTKPALVLAMLVARILDPRSKLATARGLNSETCFSSLSELLGLEKADEDDLYSAMDWLAEKQELIENELANRHLTEGSLVLYDVSSTGSKKAHAKAAMKKTSEKLPVHSFRTLMADLATIVKNKFQSQGLEASLTFEKITQPTFLQQKALDLLEVSLICTQ